MRVEAFYNDALQRGARVSHLSNLSGFLLSAVGPTRLAAVVVQMFMLVAINYSPNNSAAMQ